MTRDSWTCERKDGFGCIRPTAKHLVRWIGVGMSKFYDWRARYGKVNEHNRLVILDSYDCRSPVQMIGEL